MRFKSLLYALVLYCLTTQVPKSVQVSGNITFPDDLETLCPHSSFCEHSQDDLHLPPGYGEGVIPCCSSRSCVEDCGRKRNCCKYEYDMHKLDETLGTTCKQLNTIPYDLAPDEPFYHIVFLCPDRSQHCHTKSIPDWGRFYPVYSYESEMLYYNPYCADCHGQVNITAFDPLVTCSKVWDSYFTSAMMSKKGFENTDCVLNFIPKTHLDLSNEMCYPSIRRQCKLKDLHNNEIYDSLCQSFNATFYTRYMDAFGNVYCFICSSEKVFESYTTNGLFSTEYEFCPARQVVKTALTENEFSILLDNSFSYKGDVQLQNEGDRTWCTTDGNEEICRPLFCPEGQTYYDGQCVYIGSSWYFKHVGIIFQLKTPPGARMVTIADISPSSFSEATTVIPPVLERPGFEDWDLTLLYNTQSDKSTVSYFIALLLHKRKVTVPKIFIKKIMSSLNDEWKLHTNGLSFKLKPLLSKYSTYVYLKNDSDILPEWYGMNLFDDELEQATDKDLVNFLVGQKSLFETKNRIKVIFITKLYFCTLIELENRDWVDWTLRIYIPDKDKFLEDGEYIFVKDEFESFRVRICLEDFQRDGTWAFARIDLYRTISFSFIFSLVFMLI